jgi:hypothetical protein
MMNYVEVDGRRVHAISGGYGSEILIAAAVVAIVATAASTYIAYESSQQQASNAKKIAKYNAAVAENQATAAEQAAAADADLIRDRARRVRAAAIARVGGSGLALQGSPLEVLAEDARQTELDALRTKHAGALRAGDARVRGTQELFYGATRAQAANYQGQGAILSGVSSIASQAYSYGARSGYGGGGTTNPSLLGGA